MSVMGLARRELHYAALEKLIQPRLRAGHEMVS